MALEDLEVLRVLEVEQFMHSLESRNLQESTRYSYCLLYTSDAADE